jgi:hypothetical protein
MLITNDPISPEKSIIGRCARRMSIEQRLAESIRTLGLDALAYAGADSRLQHRPQHPATTVPADQRRYLTSIVSLDRRAYPPVLHQAELPTVPWWATDDAAPTSPETTVECVA